ncbi:MAG: ATP-binding protein, partial [Alphaproteobacteria bacterium]
ETAEHWFAQPSRELLGRSISEVVGDPLSHSARHRIDAVLAGEPQFFEGAQTYPDGQTREVTANYIPHFDESGLVLGFYALVVDITERRALEDRLRQSEKMKAVGQLTGGIAHEFNNLLQVVTGNFELLEETVLADPESSRQIQAINRAVGRGSELTNRLLSFARQQPLAPKALEIGEMLAEMQGMLGQTLGETVEVKVEPAAEVWATEADPGQLENALLNLALNARDAMPGGGVITLLADNIRLDGQAAASHEDVVPGDYVVLSVADTGGGMTEEVISHAFEPFFTTKDIGEGTGLGLSMVYGFARQSGGFAEIESEIGVGTTMRLYLPRLTQTKDEEMAVQDRPSVVVSPGSSTILLVEDDANVRESLAGQLTKLGHRVIEAHDGAAALAALAGELQVDLLFTDVVMPGGLSSLELARQVLLLRPEIKVLYTTGYSEDVVAKSGHLEENAIVLYKPYEKTKLSATISRILN